MNLLDLMVKISVDDQASEKVGGIASDIKSGLGTAAKVGVAAAAAVGTATAAVTTAFVDGANAVAQYGDSIDKNSQKMGMSAQAYQEWEAVMQHSGTSMESMRAGMKTLANAVENGNEAFQRIGLTQEQIASMSQEELFAATIEGLQNVDNETERTYLAGQLLGRGATELGALLNTSAEETQAMRDRVHELGGVMSDEAVKAAAQYQDSLQDMMTAVQGIKNRVFGAFLPSITTVMDGMQEILSGNMDEGLAKVREGIDGAVAVLTENLPQFVEQGGQLVGALVTGFLENFPNLVMALADGITQLVNDLADHSDEVLDGAGNLFMTIVSALTQIVPPLIGALANLIGSLVAGIVSRAPDILGAALQLFLQIAAAAGQSVAQVLAAINNMMGQVLSSIGGFVGQMFEAGANIIKGLVDGIKSAVGGAVDAVGGALASIREMLPFSPAKKGPFSGKGWTLYSGRSIMQGLAEGIMQGAYMAEDAMTEAAKMVNGVGFNAALPSLQYAVAGQNGSYGAFGSTTNIYVGDAIINAPEDIKAIFLQGFTELRQRGLM